MAGGSRRGSAEAYGGRSPRTTPSLPSHPTSPGGSAADDDLTGGWWLLTGEDVVRPPAKDAAGVLVTAMSPTVHVAITLTALHAQTRHSGVVTAAGADGRTIEKIDGRPAAEVYDEWCDGAIGAKLRGGGDAPQNILGETTCFPLARQIEDGDGQTAHHLIHPSFVHPPTGAMETFADVREGETLLLMNAKEEAIVGAVGGATSKAVAWAGPGFERPSGAMVIYCAGCFLATRPHIGLVAESIRRGLASGGRGGKRSGGSDDSGGGCAFVGGFTYGEQGPIGENTHANLMYNVLLFGEAKPAEAQLPYRQPSAEELARSTASALSEATVLKQMLAQVRSRHVSRGCPCHICHVSVLALAWLYLRRRPRWETPRWSRSSRPPPPPPPRRRGRRRSCSRSCTTS